MTFMYYGNSMGLAYEENSNVDFILLVFFHYVRRRQNQIELAFLIIPTLMLFSRKSIQGVSAKIHR